MRQSRSFVYFIQREFRDLIKIGISIAPDRRLKDLRIRGERLRLLATIPGAGALEASLHERFHADQYPAELEWFFPSPALLQFIQSLDGQREQLHASRQG